MEPFSYCSETSSLTFIILLLLDLIICLATILSWNSKSFSYSLQSRSWQLRRWDKYWLQSVILSRMLHLRELIGMDQAILAPRSYANSRGKMASGRCRLRISSSWSTTLTLMEMVCSTIMTSCKFCSLVIIHSWGRQPPRDQIRSCILMSSCQWESKELWANSYTRKSNCISNLKILRDLSSPVMILVSELLSKQ